MHATATGCQAVTVRLDMGTKPPGPASFTTGWLSQSREYPPSFALGPDCLQKCDSRIVSRLIWAETLVSFKHIWICTRPKMVFTRSRVLPGRWAMARVAITQIDNKGYYPLISLFPYSPLVRHSAPKRSPIPQYLSSPFTPLHSLAAFGTQTITEIRNNLSGETPRPPSKLVLANIL